MAVSFSLKTPLIGDYQINNFYFDFALCDFNELQKSNLNELEKRDFIYRYLIDLILKEEDPCFLLPAVLEYFRILQKAEVLQGTFHFSHFELWLNDYSGLLLQQNLYIRGKIAGKWIARSEYQQFFPIGMGQIYPGSHFVCAHASPDIDTVVASFWSWLDAFAAKVSEALHIWNVPGGCVPKQIQNILENFLGEHAIDLICNASLSLNARAMDLMAPLAQESYSENLQQVHLRADVDEIRQVLDQQAQVLVTYHDQDGKQLPLGIIRNEHINKTFLGTASLRDFCNRDEAKIAPHLEIISVIDHHRSNLKTSMPAVCVIGDVQSSNVLMAEQNFAINDRLCNHKLPHFIHEHRVFFEYFCFLVAILDDTDLLTKVTCRDLYAVAELLNRMKSLIEGSDRATISLDDIEKNEWFIKLASQRLLQNQDLYSIYKKIYSLKELEMENNIFSCVTRQDFTFFSDTKSQGNCARVGQTKLFVNNFTALQEVKEQLFAAWVQKSNAFYVARPECDLFIHMISTVPGADEMYSGWDKNYTHCDELWFWIPQTSDAIDHLNHFLHGFKTNPELKNNHLYLEYFETSTREFSETFSQHLHHQLQDKIRQISTQYENLAFSAILKFKAGTINSRKASIAPFLPH